jgi:hypothetical protein
MKRADLDPLELHPPVSGVAPLPSVQVEDPMDYRVLHTFRKSRLSTSSQMDLSPIWQEALPDSSPTFTEPHYIAPATHNAQS